VRATASTTGARLEVIDEGPGIAGPDSDRVFERFYRADSARSSTAGGAGLGLAIARWIVELHGGDIHVETNEPHGCRMVVTIPGPTALAARDLISEGR
jgi:signal transduction histidine kinase